MEELLLPPTEYT